MQLDLMRNIHRTSIVTVETGVGKSSTPKSNENKTDLKSGLFPRHA